MPILVRELEDVEWIVEWKIQTNGSRCGTETAGLLLDRFPDCLRCFTFAFTHNFSSVRSNQSTHSEKRCSIDLHLVRAEKPAIRSIYGEFICPDRSAAGVVPTRYYKPLSITVSFGEVSGRAMLREGTPSMEEWTCKISDYPLDPGHHTRFCFVFSIKFKSFGVSEMVEALKHTTDYLFLQQSHCDVQFCFPNDEKSIGGHVKILSSRSSVFAAMFQHDMQEFKTGKVFIQDTERDIFYQLLHYIYSGMTWTSLTEDTAKKLLLAAKKYKLTGLSLECINFLASNILWERAVDLMIWAYLHSFEKIKEAALDVVAQNGKQICLLKAWEELMSKYPHLCLEATRRMTA